MLILCLTLIDDEEETLKFEEIYNKYRLQMIYTAQKILGNYHDAENAVQDTFIKIARNMKKISKLNSNEVFSYVIKAVQNTSINLLESKERHKTIDIDDCYELDDRTALTDLCVLENYEIIVKCIGKMDIIYRDVFYLYYIDDVPLKEIAQKLDRNQATVRKQISRAREVFIKNMKKELELGEGL